MLGCFVWYHAAMKEFFHGWRRKAGLVTLVMACLFLGLWLRSRFYEDDIRFRVGRHTVHVFHLFESGLAWISIWEPTDGPREIRENGATSVMKLMNSRHNIEWEAERREGSDAEAYGQVAWHWNFGGCRYGNQPTDPRSGVGSKVLQAPYNLLVLLPTLLSAYLILWKPRKRDSRPPQS